MSTDEGRPDDDDAASGDADNDTGAGATLPRQPTPADLEPGTQGWRTWVAMSAHSFFKTPQDPGVAAAIGKTVHPTTIELRCIADYSKYLHTVGLRDAGNVVALTQVTRALEQVGFLLPCGTAPNVPPFMAQQYMTQGGASPGQVGGNLWLSEIFGAGSRRESERDSSTRGHWRMTVRNWSEPTQRPCPELRLAPRRTIRGS
jgi:hypothetical protein